MPRSDENVCVVKLGPIGPWQGLGAPGEAEPPAVATCIVEAQARNVAEQTRRSLREAQLHVAAILAADLVEGVADLAE